MEWTKLKDKQPDPESHGGKVLLYRVMNAAQKDRGVSIFDTAKVKHCNPDETWWMPLPAPPKS